MRIWYAIANAAWCRGTGTLVNDLRGRANVFRSRRREHAAEWARRIWSAVPDRTHAVILNDDVELHPQFLDACEAIVKAVPDKVIALHGQAPGLRGLPGPWARCYWLTGPAYILPPGAARRLLDWGAWEFVSRVNEDNAAIHEAWERQDPIWQAIPAIVRHDTSIPSTLGYDNHPFRTSSVPWTDYAVDVTDVDYWRPRSDPPFVENPWMPALKMDLVRRVMRSGGRMCSMCLNQQAVWGTEHAAICMACANGVKAGVK